MSERTWVPMWRVREAYLVAAEREREAFLAERAVRRRAGLIGAAGPRLGQSTPPTLMCVELEELHRDPRAFLSKD